MLLMAAAALSGQDQVAGAVPAAPGEYQPPESERELLAVDDGMRRFFAARVDRHDPEREVLRDIIIAVLRPEGLGFTYDAEGTYDARETFRRRRGNCQGFAFLVVAVAREYGLRVVFQDIATARQWNRFDRFVATVRHTNVRMIGDREDYIVDLRPDLGRATFNNDRYVVRDRRAFAHFYTTAGFFRLVHGDGEGALRWMRRATEIDGGSAIVWSNLGNLHLQLGDVPAARAAFERALRLEPRMDDALSGLVRVLRLQARPEDLQLADRHERRAQAYRERNPYYLLHLATLAKAGGDLTAAERWLRRAIHLKRDEPLFHEELIAGLRAGGRPAEAERAEARLARLRAELAKGETYVLP